MALRDKGKRVQNRHDADEEENPKRANWNTELHKVFIKLCVDEKMKGNKPTANFSSEGWENITKNFFQETNKAYTRRQLKNHFENMRNEWQAWIFIKQRATGLSWDSETKTPVASEGWWEKLAKVNKLVLKFKKKGLEHEDDNFDLFSGAVATGEYAWAPSQGLLSLNSYQMSGYNDGSRKENRRDDIEDENYEEMGSSENDFTMDEFGLQDSPVDDTAPPTIGKRHKRQTDEDQSSKSVHKRRKLTSVDRISAAIDRMATQMERLTNAKLALINGSSVKKTLRILEQVPGVAVGGPLYFFALRIFEKPYYRELFIILGDNDLRLGWLKDMELREQPVYPPQQFGHFSQQFAQAPGEFSQQFAQPPSMVAQPSPSVIPCQFPADSDASPSHSASDA